MTPRVHKFRFWLDENFPAHAGEFLKSLGHHVCNTKVFANTQKTDFAQLEAAIKERAVFLTSDKDFLHGSVLLELRKRAFGVVIIHTDNPTPEQYGKILKKFLQTFTPKQIVGKVIHSSANKSIIVEL